MLDLTRGAWSPTSTSSAQVVWSQDGRRMAFYRASHGSNDFFVKPIGSDRAGEELVLATPELKSLHDWSPDGRFLLYQGESPARNSGIDVWALPLEGPRKPIALAQSRFDEKLPQVSPDGKWIAYESNESGRFEIYAQPFPGPGERVRISTTGGAQVRWRRDGKELFYVGLDEQLMAVPLRVTADSKTLEPGAAVPLFVTRIPGGAAQGGGNRQQYVVSPDGQRFLVATLVEGAAAPPITLILNWHPPAK
jgi:Tol biopolymer transport system component